MKLLTRLFLRSCPGLLVAAMSATPALATQDPSASLLETLEDPDATLADVTALLDAGANPNALGSQGWTPLLCGSFRRKSGNHRGPAPSRGRSERT